MGQGEDHVRQPDHVGQPVLRLTRHAATLRLYEAILFQIPTKYKPEASARELSVYPVFDEGENRSAMKYFPCWRYGISQTEGALVRLGNALCPAEDSRTYVGGNGSQKGSQRGSQKGDQSMGG